MNFDRTQNYITILGNIYLSEKINNETYTLKEVMQQPDIKKLKWQCTIMLKQCSIVKSGGKYPNHPYTVITLIWEDKVVILKRQKTNDDMVIQEKASPIWNVEQVQSKHVLSCRSAAMGSSILGNILPGCLLDGSNDVICIIKKSKSTYNMY